MFLLLVALCPTLLTAQTRSLDLTRHGLQGASNPGYKPRLFTTAVDYLLDGSLVIAFPAPYTSLDPQHAHTFGVQRDIVLHLDPKTGRVLHRFEASVNNEIRALAATPDGGFLLIEGREIVFFNSECRQTASITVPLDVISIELHPSRKYITFAKNGVDALEMTTISTTSRTSVHQLESVHTPVVMFDDGYSYLERYQAPGISHGFSRTGHQIVNTGYAAHFLTAHPTDHDFGFVFDCSVVFEAATAESAAFSTCGDTSFVRSSGTILFKDSVRHALPLLFSSSQSSTRVAYSYVIAPPPSTVQLARERARESGVRVIDLMRQSLVAALPVTPQPRVGGAIALSPDGHQLAVLTDSAVLLTDLP